MSGVLDKYDYSLMRETVKQMKVYSNRTVEVEFFIGKKVTVEI